MAFDRTKLLLSFAFIGFLFGSAAYFLFNWIIINMGILYIPFPIMAPWFLSGIAGSLLAMITVYVAAHFSAQK